MDKITNQQFRTALWILLHNFHAVNRKIFACLIDEVNKVKSELITLEDAGNITKILENAKPSSEQDLKFHMESNAQTDGEIFIVQQKFLTKKLEENIKAISLIDFSSNTYTCVFLHTKLDDYVIKHTDEGELCLQALTQRNEKETSERWLEYVLKPKLLNWARSEQKNNTAKPIMQSLQLIDVEKYNDLYKDLKAKYSENLKTLWLEANESTDPLKFIYEDLAIASYLICLWRSTSNTRPLTAFADLGCGNGLLVNILNEEGYNGYGYDIRKRKLWSLYPANVQQKLIEAAIEPEDFSPPHDVDWLIGNHSDELSPWLPVLAASCSFEMSYFLLPCCAYELSGAKFQRRNAKLSTYQDFLEYAYDLSQNFGFQTLKDRLKIPSTKRLALVGRSRIYKATDYKTKVPELKEFVKKEIQRFPHASKEDVQIKLREKNEIVRNCTKVDKNVIERLVSNIFEMLLKKPSPESKEEKLWQTGGRLTIKDIALSLTSDELKNIKAECGGVKTLLRNKHEIFQFYENELIGLRKPEKRDRPQTIKKRSCYFDEHHPDGCPLSEKDCTFLHRNERYR